MEAGYMGESYEKQNLPRRGGRGGKGLYAEKPGRCANSPNSQQEQRSPADCRGFRISHLKSCIPGLLFDFF